MHNDDPTFTSLLEQLFGLPITPNVRRVIYIFVCIPTRILLYALVSMWRRSIHMGVRFVSAATAARLASLPPGRQWWSREWSLACALATVCVPTAFLHFPLFISLCGGIAQSLTVTFV
jgi:hypothetical protein